MTAVKRFARPSNLEEALAAKRADPGAAYLAGGTLLLAGDGRDRPESVIDLGPSLPRDIAVEAEVLLLGAGLSFQDLAESAIVPPFLIDAALSMANRNTRNRATLGGNLAADKSCSSLVPLLLALGTELEVLTPFASPSGAEALSPPMSERLSLEAWLCDREKPDSPRASDLVLRILVSLGPRRRAAYRRWNRLSCDLSVLGAAVAFDLEGQGSGAQGISSLHIALGGVGPRARRFPAIEELFEGSALPSRESIEAAVAPLLHPIDDLRASAAFKRLRASQLVAEALLDAAAGRGEGGKA